MSPSGRNLLCSFRNTNTLSISRATAQQKSIQSCNMSTLAAFRVPNITNEPNKHYAKGSPDRQALADAIKALQQKAPLEVPLVVSGKFVKTDSVSTQNNP